MSSVLFINYYPNIDTDKQYTIAGFDLDYTIIKTKSGNVFPKDKNDWVLWNDSVKTKLMEVSKSNDYLIVIFSNQKNLKSAEEFREKINNIKKLLNINFIFIASLEDDVYRKPRIGMYNFIKTNLNIKINKKSSFYVGDMAGRNTDKFDTDIKFAKNLKFKFYVPEEFFLDQSGGYSYQLSGYLLNNNHEYPKISIKPSKYHMVVLSGYPGSGKSYLASHLETLGFGVFSRDSLKNKFIKKIEETMATGAPVVIEGLYPSNEKRQELINLAKTHKYNTTYILVNTSYELSYHLNLYRNLFENKNKVPEIVYMKYRKSFEYPIKTNWDRILEYHPTINDKINKFFLY